VSIIIAHAALLLVFDIFLIIREIVRLQAFLEVSTESLNDTDVLNPRLLRRVSLLSGRWAYAWWAKSRVNLGRV
jgi:hypothetical protein